MERVMCINAITALALGTLSGIVIGYHGNSILGFVGVVGAGLGLYSYVKNMTP
jgi:hypothetical protein